MNIPARKGSLLVQDARTKRRNAAEARFKAYGLAAIAVGVLALVVLVTSILGNGLSAFRQTEILLNVELPEAKLDKSGIRDLDVMKKVTTLTYGPIIAKGLKDAIVEHGIEIEGLTAKDRGALISKEASAQLRDRVLADPSLVGQTIQITVLASGRIDGYYKGRVSLASAELDSNVTPAQLKLADALKEKGLLVTKFNPAFLTAPDASDQRPEAAGLGVAILGSAYMMVVVLVLALPIGVAASIYLEEFAPKNRWTDLIEVNVSNLAAYTSADGLFGEPSTALPVQVYNWTQRADTAFFERASGAIILRRRFERRC